ncbi:tRNA pseudouridine(38-40) synthase TruA [bacterium LRH843]|nr:tRNA pseudouridine(38-40) synthase TruA [bacterium LRH843]
MNRVALCIAYDGTLFSGYQVQPRKRTVQAELERALAQIHKGQEISVIASGRTDTGVHARAQVVHFDSFLSIEASKWPKALNSLLPADVRISKAAIVRDDFHARFDAVIRQYHYRVLARKEGDVFRRNMAYHFPYKIDMEAMQLAARHLIGTYDFSSFCSSKTDVVDKVRTLHDISITCEADEIIFTITGNGFLHNMVRIIIGTLLEIGTGKRTPEELVSIRDARDRTSAGKTAPGHGLYLLQVTYESPLF